MCTLYILCGHCNLIFFPCHIQWTLSGCPIVSPLQGHLVHKHHICAAACYRTLLEIIPFWNEHPSKSNGTIDGATKKKKALLYSTRNTITVLVTIITQLKDYHIEAHKHFAAQIVPINKVHECFGKQFVSWQSF